MTTTIPFPPILKILADEHDAVAYRPRFTELTNHLGAGILLQQMIYWHEKMGGDFYKFKQEAPNHDRYKEGDSWCEELGFTRYEFDSAIKVIGTKITKGVSLNEVMEQDLPEPEDGEAPDSWAERLRNALRCMVAYWTDGDRVTWYRVNHSLVAKVVSQLYIRKVVSLRYVVKLQDDFRYVKLQDSFTLHTENTSKTTAGEPSTPETPTQPEPVVAAAVEVPTETPQPTEAPPTEPTASADQDAARVRTIVRVWEKVVKRDLTAQDRETVNDAIDEYGHDLTEQAMREMMGQAYTNPSRYLFKKIAGMKADAPPIYEYYIPDNAKPDPPPTSEETWHLTCMYEALIALVEGDPEQQWRLDARNAHDELEAA